MKKALAIVLVMVFVLTSLTACNSDTQAKIEQIQDDFNSLVTDAADLSVLYVTAVASSLDVSQITDKYLEIMSFINSFASTILTDLSSDALDAVIDQIDDMKNALSDVKTILENTIGNASQLAKDATSEDTDQILSEITGLKTALEELKNVLQPAQ